MKNVTAILVVYCLGLFCVCRPAYSYSDNATHLADYAAGMGELILDSQEEGKVKYEMRHQVGPETYLFPVIFIQDEQGRWKIAVF